MLGPINAYQVQQQTVQNAQARTPNAQDSLAQKQTPARSERLNETRNVGEPIANTNDANAQTNSRDQQLKGASIDDVKALISQGNIQRGSLLDVIA